VRFTSRGNHYSQERMRFFLCNHWRIKSTKQDW
jgi:hypothetical protein